MLLLLGGAARLVGRRGERDQLWVVELLLLGGGLMAVVLSFW
ncbi:hypothetical protein ACQB6R_12435 [Propionibacteriaceae bacterium G1746]